MPNPKPHNIPEPIPRGDSQSEEDVLWYYIAKQFWLMLEVKGHNHKSMGQIAKELGLSKGTIHYVASQKTRPGAKVWKAFKKRFANDSLGELVKLARTTWNQDVLTKGVIVTAKSDARTRAIAAARQLRISEEVLKLVPEATPFDEDKTELDWFKLIQYYEQKVHYQDLSLPKESPSDAQELLTRRQLQPVPPVNPSSSRIKICK